MGHQYSNRGIFVNELQSFRGIEWAKGGSWGSRGVKRGNEGRGGSMGGSKGTIGILIGGFLGND